MITCLYILTCSSGPCLLATCVPTWPYLPFLGPCLHETICLAQVVVYMGCCRRRTILHLSAPLASGRAKQGNQEESLNYNHQMPLKSPKCSDLEFLLMT